MDQVGWPVTVLDGGYQTWRRQVTAALYDQPLAHRLVLLDGPTGSGKTALLTALAEHGSQTLDLEALARHRGSLFGAVAGGQPSQKAFETALHDVLSRLDPARPVIAEAESSKIGARVIPPSVWAAMSPAPVIEMTVPLQARVAHIVETYADIAADPAALDAALIRLPRHHARAVVADWRAMAARGQIAELAAELIEAHYDPAYLRTGETRGRTVLERVSLSDLTPAGLAVGVRGVIAALDGARGPA